MSLRADNYLLSEE